MLDESKSNALADNSILGLKGCRAEAWSPLLKTISVDRLKSKSVRGGVVTLSAQALTFLVQTGSTMVLARLLSPSDFGLQGMVMAVTGILALFRDVGLGAATIQRVEVTQEQLSTLFWINVAIGVFLTILGMSSAPLLVSFFKEPRLFWVTIATASAFLLGGVATQHAALLMRQMRFAAIAKITILSLGLSTALGIGMAETGYGYWSLIAMSLFGSALTSAGYWIAVPWRPGWPSRGCGVRAMLNFGGVVTLNNLVVYLGYNAEKILLGRFWGAGALGLYGRAYSLINLPLQQLHSSMNAVAFPALSRIQDDPRRLCSSFLKGYSVLLSFSIPGTVCCILFADEVIPLVLGPKWIEAVPLFKLLGPTILAFGFINPFGWFLTATGRVGRSLRIALLIAPTLIIGIAVGLQYGPQGVALAYSAVMILLICPVIAWAIHGTGITWHDYWKAAMPPVVSGIAAAVAGLCFDFVCHDALPVLVRLSAGLLVVLGAYAGMILFAMRQKDLYADLGRQLLHRNSAAGSR